MVQSSGLHQYIPEIVLQNDGVSLFDWSAPRSCSRDGWQNCMARMRVETHGSKLRLAPVHTFKSVAEWWSVSVWQECNYFMLKRQLVKLHGKGTWALLKRWLAKLHGKVEGRISFFKAKPCTNTFLKQCCRMMECLSLTGVHLGHSQEMVGKTAWLGSG